METTEHVHWKQLVNPNYIGAYCVPSDLTVRIVSVGREIVKGENGKSEECTVAKLDSQKPFIVNRTNAKTISKLAGSPFIDKWVGQYITLFPTTTKVAGDTVECLRIRPTRPNMTTTPPSTPSEPAPVDYTNQIATLRNCQTLQDLQFEYSALNKAGQIAMAKVKDEMKLKLTPRSDEPNLL